MMRQHAEINFIKRRQRPSAWALIVLLFLALGLSYSIYRYMQAWRAGLQSQDQRASELGQWRAAKRPVLVSAQSIPSEEVQAISQAIDRLNVPWPAILAAIEQARPADVIVLKIGASQQSRRVQIEAQSKHIAQLVRFMDALPLRPPFHKATPLLQESASTADGLVYKVTFDAHWSNTP